MDDVETKELIKQKEKDLQEASEQVVFWQREHKSLLAEIDRLNMSLPQPPKGDDARLYKEALARKQEEKRKLAAEGRLPLSPIDQARKFNQRKPRPML